MADIGQTGAAACAELIACSAQLSSAQPVHRCSTACIRAFCIVRFQYKGESQLIARPSPIGTTTARRRALKQDRVWPGAWSRGRLDCTAQSLSKRWGRPEPISPCSPWPWPWPWFPSPPPGQQTIECHCAKKKHSPRWSLLLPGRSESPAAWKREKGPESAQVAPGMLTPGRRAFWALGSHSRLPAPLALSPRREATK